MKKKIKNYLFFFFNNNLKYNLYKKNFYKLINFSKKNFDIISYDFFFFIFKNIDLNDLEIILNLIKILKINLLCKFPNDYLINYNEYKTIFFRKNFNFIKFYINKISKLVLKNYFLVNDIFNSNKKTFKKFESKIENLESNLNLKKIFFFKFKKNKKEYFIKKKRNNFSKKFLNFKKYLYSKKKFYLNKNFSLLNFLVKNIKKYKLKKNNNYKKLLFFLKNKKIKFKINLNMIDDFYKIILKKYNYIDNLRNKLYDYICNILNISYLKFNFFFLKNGSNLKWILNLIENNNFSKSEILNIKLFIKKKTWKIKKIENKYFISITKLLKLFNIIEINKLKLDLIKNNIIKSKLKLINKITKKYYDKNYYNDIIQESKLSLIKSINNYNKNLNVNFNIFIIKNIKKSINNYIYKNSKLINLPIHISSLMIKLNKTIKEYNNIYNQDPDIDFIKNKLGLSKDKIKNVFNFYKEPLSINRQSYNSDDDLSEYLKDFNNFDFDEEIFNNDLRDYIEFVMSNLNSRSSNIISMRYGINFSRRYTLDEIGNIYNLSKERIRQIQNENLKTLKFLNDNEKLKNFFNYKYKYYNFKN